MTGQLRTGVLLCHTSVSWVRTQTVDTFCTLVHPVLVNDVAQWNIRWKLRPHVTYHWFNKASVLFRAGLGWSASRWHMVRWTWCTGGMWSVGLEIRGMQSAGIEVRGTQSAGHVVIWVWSGAHVVES